jgi:two-component system, LuxR family, sensor kinase FixL
METERVNLSARNCLIGLAYLVAYVCLDALSMVQPLLKLGITPWNPDAGLTLAFLLMRGWRQAPWTFAAALMAELIVRKAAAPWFTMGLASLVIAVSYGALSLALTTRRFDQSLASRQAALEFSLGAAIAAFVTATGYAGAFLMAGLLPVDVAADAISRNWVGDLNGVFTLTPLLLAAPRIVTEWPALRRQGALIGGQAAVLAALLWLVFLARPLGDLPLVYILFAPVVWITLTWGVAGAAGAALLIQLGFMVGAAPRLDASALIEIQYFLVTLAFTTMFLGAVTAERAKALARVAASEAEQRALLTAAPDAVLATNLAGDILSANLAAERLFDAAGSDILGTRLAHWLPDLDPSMLEGRCRVSGMRRSGQRFPAEIARVRLDFPARAGFLIVARDMTEHDQAQTQLRERDRALARAMRFALAGELATALTHELNQPITALVSYLKSVEILAAPREVEDPRFVETVHKATREALRASDVLKRLREFYRSGGAKAAVIDSESLIAEVLSAFAERTDRLGVEVTSDFRITREVCTDRIQLQMVLHNLVSNALDALADVADGSRRLRLSLETDGDRLRILVSDSGRGILLQIRRQLFEPFVTSKLDGMGLGLAISRSLLRSQGGELRLDTSGTSGTCFLIELPLTATKRTAA